MQNGTKGLYVKIGHHVSIELFIPHHYEYQDYQQNSRKYHQIAIAESVFSSGPAWPMHASKIETKTLIQ